MCVCVCCVYVHTYVYVFVHFCVCMHVCICVCMYVYTCVYTSCLYMSCLCVCVRVCVCTLTLQGVTKETLLTRMAHWKHTALFIISTRAYTFAMAHNTIVVVVAKCHWCILLIKLQCFRIPGLLGKHIVTIQSVII